MARAAAQATTPARTSIDMKRNGTIDIGRRRLIGAAGAAGLVTLLGSRHVSAAEAHAAMPPAAATTDFKPDLELELNAVADEIRVLQR